MEENVDIYSKHSIDVSELSMDVKSYIDPVSYEAKYGCGIRSNAEDIHAYSEGLLRRPSEYVPKLKIPINPHRSKVIPSEYMMYKHREKVYKVSGTAEKSKCNVVSGVSSRENTERMEEEHEDEQYTTSTAPMTEYSLHEIDMIESMFRDQDLNKPNPTELLGLRASAPVPNQVPTYYCMRYNFMGFLWKILRKCCSWISCIVYFR